MSQWLIQTTKIFYSLSDLHLCFHFEKRSATYDLPPALSKGGNGAFS